jgi:mevalonate kinase
VREFAGDLSGLARQGGAIAVSSQLSMAMQNMSNVDSSGVRQMAEAIRDVAMAMEQIDPNKALEFRTTVRMFGTAQIAQAAAAAQSLRDSDVERIKELVSQANELAAASRVSQGDELNSLVRSVARIAQTQSGGGAGGASYSGPSKVEAVLKLGGRTLDRHIVNIVSERFGINER